MAVKSTFKEKLTIKRLLEECSVLKVIEDGVEYRELREGYTLDSIALSAGNHLNASHVKHVAKELDIKFTKPPKKKEELSVQERITNLENLVKELEERILNLEP